MASFVPVYEAFEAGWRGVRGVDGGGDGGVDGGGDGGSEDEEKDEGRGRGGGGGWGEGWGEEQRVIQGLRRLYMRPLERGARLRDDVEGILASKGSEKKKKEGERSGSAIEHLHQRRRPRLDAFTDHIRSVASAAPGKRHLLLAYAWVLYMALFSGGRYIRARLRGAGAGFWGEKGVEGGKGLGDDEKEAGMDGYLGFWTFEGEEDGEDLKAEFKDRFASVEGILTEAEKDEVVQEAVFIMQSMIGVVVEISEVFGTGLSEAAAGGRTVDDEMVDGRVHDEPSMRWLLLKHVLPMGMVELIAAGARSAASVGMGTSFWSARAKY